MPINLCMACMKPIQISGGTCPHCGSPVPCIPNAPNSLQPGYELGRFVIGKEIGRGGYGITYIAFDKRLQRVQCIKEYFPKDCRRLPNMHPEILPGKEQEFRALSERFLQEARIMSTLAARKSANVVDVYDQLDENGTTYIIMEYLDGCTMDEYITRQKHGVPWQEAQRIMCEVLRTLEDMHRLDFLHRDISLSNVFRVNDEAGSIRVIDFGSAAVLSRAMNQPGSAWPSSKKYYSPPEQVQNAQQGPWTDVFAAGVCLFKLVAGGWP